MDEDLAEPAHDEALAIGAAVLEHGVEVHRRTENDPLTLEVGTIVRQKKDTGYNSKDNACQLTRKNSGHTRKVSMEKGSKRLP